MATHTCPECRRPHKGQQAFDTGASGGKRLLCRRCAEAWLMWYLVTHKGIGAARAAELSADVFGGRNDDQA